MTRTSLLESAQKAFDDGVEELRRRRDDPVPEGFFTAKELHRPKAELDVLAEEKKAEKRILRRGRTRTSYYRFKIT